MKSGFFLDIVVGEGTAIFKLFAGEDETLLIRWNSFLILDLSFDVVDCVRWFNIKGDCFTRKGLYKNLHDLKKYENYAETPFTFIPYLQQ